VYRFIVDFRINVLVDDTATWKWLKFWNASYHYSVWNIFSSHLLSKKPLPVVWYGCEHWSLFLRKNIDRRFSRKELRRLLGPKREEVREGWRKSHNEELHNLYSSQNIISVFESRRMS
jgi:hypothetical protein